MHKYPQIRVLVCPLNWGLGHAARMVPVIKHLQTAGVQIFIAADGGPAALLKSFFPDVSFILFGSYPVRYSSGKSQTFKLLLQLPGFLIKRFRDRIKVKKLVQENRIDLLISDNRPGLWNKDIYTVYVTHQVMVKLPGKLSVFEKLLSYLHQKLEIRQYNECWVPDVPGIPNLSGALSHRYKLPENASFIGLLSRFATSSNSAEDYENTAAGHTDLLILLSGPEPQRTTLEKILTSQASKLPVNCTVIRGLPDESEVLSGYRNINFLNHADDDAFISLAAKTKYIICRAGYSTLMDLVALNKKALIIPTPGQTEQEYLAEHLADSGMFLPVEQDGVNLLKQLPLLDAMGNKHRLEQLFFVFFEKVEHTLKKVVLKAETGGKQHPVI